MARETLKRHLRDLHEELATNETLDAETRALLTQVAGDIEQVLADEHEDRDGARGRIESAALSFEASHPRLARVMSDVTDTLAKLGI